MLPSTAQEEKEMLFGSGLRLIMELRSRGQVCGEEMAKERIRKGKQSLYSRRLIHKGSHCSANDGIMGFKRGGQGIELLKQGQDYVPCKVSLDRI